MKLHLIDGAPLFARIRAFDIECPACSKVYQVGVTRLSRASSTWDPATARFRCIECGWRATLGMLAWLPAPGDKGARPDTLSPNVEAVLRRRRAARVGGQRRLPGRGGGELGPAPAAAARGLQETERQTRTRELADSRVESSVLSREVVEGGGPVNRLGIKEGLRKL